MGVIKRRNAIKKQGPICLDRSFITFHAEGSNRNFSVHEDLLCSNSKYFQRLLQKDRKDIDGNCSICHKELDPNDSDLTFCESQCGQNFHNHCIERLKSSSTAEMTCPICRSTWTTKPRNITLPYRLGYGGQRAIQSYVDWLYMGELYIDEAFCREDSGYNLQLLRTWKISEKVEDDTFKNAVIAECVAAIEYGAKHGFDLACIEYAYKFGSDCMQDFLIDLSLMDNNLNYMKNHGETLPLRFLHKFCLLALTRLKGCANCEELLEKHTEGEYEYQTETDDGRWDASEFDS